MDANELIAARTAASCRRSASTARTVAADPAGLHALLSGPSGMLHVETLCRSLMDMAVAMERAADAAEESARQLGMAAGMAETAVKATSEAVALAGKRKGKGRLQ